MKCEEIRIRDPFILPYEGKYYMYGTGCPGADNIDEGRQFWCYISEDLENWSEPGMMFHGFDGRMYFALHQPNHAPMERPHFFEIVKAEDGYALIGRK